MHCNWACSVESKAWIFDGQTDICFSVMLEEEVYEIGCSKSKRSVDCLVSAQFFLANTISIFHMTNAEDSESLKSLHESILVSCE
jgi:hypothetical protein